MTKVGNIHSLFYSSVDGRSAADEMLLDTKGIVKDKHYNQNIQRSVLLTSMYSYVLAKKHDIELPHGVLGENILMDYNPYHLPGGSRLQIGDAVLEISQHCTLCKGLSQVDAKLPKLLKNDRGIFAKVTEPGKIRTGDDIYLLD
ncbi:hypothetical protein YH65_10400 [Sulfurovum lithotrophicum]|uniref:MOSC domain-containing protein n=1 Tax=Sulfurovum lithotrophicum TaxID=206403 RepID=A0A7U4M2Q7_9BACT|nr:MOSC domain-containing protein [Sulfurovum lithotrophicum]AKF25752.1 hypothetical protein YH65_10400 [Sulfurovum lithotrophicum]